MTFTDYYELLQIAPTADADIVTAAYRKLATRYHPDAVDGDKSGEKMKLLNAARDTLIDLKTRAKYDQLWQIENTKKETIRAAKLLLDQKKYQEAKAILTGIDHPTAKKWLEQIEHKLKTQTSQFAGKVGSNEKDKPKVSGKYRNETYSSRKSEDPQESSAPSKKRGIDELAEERIRQIKDKEDAQLRKIREAEKARQEELARRREHEQVLIRTYEKIGSYAFQFDTSAYSIQSEYKYRAWKAIERRRYETALFHISKARSIDSNVSDWQVLIHYIVDRESVRESLLRLGLVGVLDLPLVSGIPAGWIMGVVIIFILFAATSNENLRIALIGIGCVAYVGIVLVMARGALYIFDKIKNLKIFLL